VIRELRLQSFKRFQDTRIPTAPLTLLTGFNSGGKSSTMQSLLLLHHALSTRSDQMSALNTVPLNAQGLNLGEFRTVLNEVKKATFSIELRTENTTVQWTFGAEDWPRHSLAVPVSKVELNGVDCANEPPGNLTVSHPALLRDPHANALLRSLLRLQFVPADRIGPAETYPLDDPARHATPGPRGERAFGNLYWFGSDPLPVMALRHPSVDTPPTLARQVEAWLADLFPGALLDPQPVQNANLMTLGVQTNKELSFHRPQNVGFGVTYVLPVIISILTARQGDIVLLENPEAHLHPRAQARIGRLCARAAAYGIQVILETHSDHVLNGIRVAVHDGQVRHEDVAILFYGGPLAESNAIVTPIGIDRMGKLDQWPGGFFDEGDRLLDRLLEPPPPAQS
jgi:predicted ATPase